MTASLRFASLFSLFDYCASQQCALNADSTFVLEMSVGELLVGEVYEGALDELNYAVACSR
ncbi:hypothetical protein MHH33_00830 [Paenisporosarcina sp. FSL H8-0542]|uniref:hypothetical protein n=1 Tax=Paenisporosarcina sp. FSL H8-0542 TaxID=2921401 RepID=UPI00315A5443